MIQEVEIADDTKMAKNDHKPKDPDLKPSNVEDLKEDSVATTAFPMTNHVLSIYDNTPIEPMMEVEELKEGLDDPEHSIDLSESFHVLHSHEAAERSELN